MPPVEKLSLYDRLGGVYSIATVVDDLIDRVMSDARLNQSPGERSAPSRATCGIQVPGDRDGLLGWRRSTKIQRQADGRIARPFKDYRHGMGGVHGRPSAVA